MNIIYIIWLRQLKRYFRARARIIGSLAQPLLFLLALGFRVENFALLPVSIIFMFLISLFFSSVGTAIGSMLDDMQGFQLIMNFVVIPLFFLSGALFPLDKVPKARNVVAAVDPLTYGVDGLRGTLISMINYGLTIDLLVWGA